MEFSNIRLVISTKSSVELKHGRACIVTPRKTPVSLWKTHLSHHSPTRHSIIHHPLRHHSTNSHNQTAPAPLTHVVLDRLHLDRVLAELAADGGELLQLRHVAQQRLVCGSRRPTDASGPDKRSHPIGGEGGEGGLERDGETMGRKG